MKLFTSTQLTIILALAGGVAQALPLAPEGPGTSTALTAREIFGREPVLFYGRQLEHDLEERGIFGFIGKMVGKVAEKIGGKNSKFSKVVNKVAGIANVLPI